MWKRDFVRQLAYVKVVAKASFKKKRAYLLCPKCEKELCHIYRSTKTWSENLAHELIYFSMRSSTGRSGDLATLAIFGDF